MEVSHDLWMLVEAARQQQPQLTSSSRSTLAQRFATSVEEQQTSASLLSTSRTISDAVVNALSRASAHVHATVAALDTATPSSTAHLQSSLLLSDAELLSVSSSLKAFTETLVKVHAVATGKGKGKKASAKKTTDEVSGTAPLSSSSLDTEMAKLNAGTGLVAHLQYAISIQEQRVAAKRLQVALAKEELALYKTELFLFGHCGVLSCSDAVAAQLAQYRPSSPAAALSSSPSPLLYGSKLQVQSSAADNVRGGGGGPHSRSPLPCSDSSTARTTSPKPSRSGFGTTFRVVDGMMQRAAQTVKAAGSHADSALHVALTGSQAAARQLLNVGTSSVDGIVMFGAGGDRGRGAPSTAGSSASAPTRLDARTLPLPPLPQDELSKEEETRLQEQSQALLQLQHEATAQDAKAVEASIRELSQLTSLMNEQVVQQTEQFSILVRNTETAHTNVQKAVGEVKKPLHAFWNPTRQLIALLWACMALVLAVNWVSR